MTTKYKRVRKRKREYRGLKYLCQSPKWSACSPLARKPFIYSVHSWPCDLSAVLAERGMKMLRLGTRRWRDERTLRVVVLLVMNLRMNL